MAAIGRSEVSNCEMGSALPAWAPCANTSTGKNGIVFTLNDV
jgi:hypothetical protein